jgi:hypothetical protein
MLCALLLYLPGDVAAIKKTNRFWGGLQIEESGDNEITYS